MKRKLSLPHKIEMNKTIKKISTKTSMNYNNQFIQLLEQLENLMQKKGEFFRARAYAKAKESIMTYKKPIKNADQLKGQKGIGSTILAKLNEYVKTGTLQVLEKSKK